MAQNPPAPVEARFLAFFRQAAAFSKALYGDSGTDPNFRYTMRPIKSDLIDEFDLTVNGDTAHLNGGGQRTYAWPGAGTPGFHLDLKLNGGGNPDWRRALHGTLGRIPLFCRCRPHRPLGSRL